MSTFNNPHYLLFQEQSSLGTNHMDIYFIVTVNCILISKHIHYYCTNGTMDKLFSGYHFEAPGAYQPAKEHETYNEINRQVVSM